MEVSAQQQAIREIICGLTFVRKDVCGLQYVWKFASGSLHPEMKIYSRFHLSDKAGLIQGVRKSQTSGEECQEKSEEYGAKGCRVVAGGTVAHRLSHSATPEKN
jgi:hypothetical protein